MSWRSILGITAVLFALASLGVIATLAPLTVTETGEAVAPETLPSVASADEQREILRVFFSKAYPAPPHAEVVLASTTSVICPFSRDCSDPVNSDWALATDLSDSISVALRRDLLAANAEESALPDPALPNVVYLPAAALPRAFMKSASDAWRSFRTAHPNAIGPVHISRIVLSHDRQHALMYSSHSWGPASGYGFFHLFVRTASGWKLSASERVWIT